MTYKRAPLFALGAIIAIVSLMLLVTALAPGEVRREQFRLDPAAAATPGR